MPSARRRATLRKAHRLDAEDIAALRAAGVDEVVAARLDPGDLDEDEAAARLARRWSRGGIDAKPAATGRVNLHAERAGVFTVDAAAIDAINAHRSGDHARDAGRQCAPSKPGEMVATVKIIPFAVAGRLVDGGGDVAGRRGFRRRAVPAARVALIQTVLPALKDSVSRQDARASLADAAGALRQRDRRRACGCRTTARPWPRRSPASAAGSDMVVVFGASAIVRLRRRDSGGHRAAGGEVIRAGMPVDPGNLLVLGRLGGTPVIGAPGCARSPKENGFDWVLDRLLAGRCRSTPRHRRHGRRRAADGDPDPPAAARAARPPGETARRADRRRSCSPPGGRPAWAGRTSLPRRRRRAAGPDRGARGDRGRADGRGRHRPPGRRGARGARRARRRTSSTIRTSRRAIPPRSAPASPPCRTTPRRPSCSSATCRRSRATSTG